MVERFERTDLLFRSLADATRRDMLRRVARREHTISELAKPYELTIAAISKHLQVLERARLVTKERRGREHIVRLSPQALERARRVLDEYQSIWEERLDRLEDYLRKK